MLSMVLGNGRAGLRVGFLIGESGVSQDVISWCIVTAHTLRVHTDAANSLRVLAKKVT